jgi:hypothetical protein
MHRRTIEPFNNRIGVTLMKLSLLRWMAPAALAVLIGACSSAATAAPPTPAQSVLAATSAPTGALPIPSDVPTAADTPTAAATAPGLGGKWNGTWTDTSPDTSNGTFALTWTQNGSNLSGTITVAGTPCISAATVTGSLNGSAITFGAVSGRVTITYTGTIAGTKMSGTYSAPNCGNATGNWQATQG